MTETTIPNVTKAPSQQRIRPQVRALGQRLPWLAVLMTITFAQRALADSWQQQLVEPGVFTYAVSGTFRPFSYVNDQQKLDGFDVAVGKAIARILHLEPRPVRYPFESLIEGLHTKRFDVAISSHTVTPQRQAQVAFSQPYYYSGPFVFIRNDTLAPDHQWLLHKDLAVSKGSSYARQASLYSSRIRIYNDDLTALDALNAGRHDAVITDYITGSLAIRQGMALAAGWSLGTSQQAMALHPQHRRLQQAVDDALTKLRASGWLQELSIQTFGRDVTVEPKGASAPLAQTPHLKKRSIDSEPAVAKEPMATANSGHGDHYLQPISHFFRTLWQTKEMFAAATWMTVKLAFLAFILATAAGLALVLLSLHGPPILTWLVNLYILLVRGTPLVVQIFLLYFGLTKLIQLPGFLAATIALAFHNTAYLAEIFRGAIGSIPQGQREAATGLGMSTLQCTRKIILPQAFRNALPALGNQGIICVKDSSLAAFIAINEIFAVATTLGANHFDQLTYLLVGACYYLILVLGITGSIRWLEGRRQVTRT